MFALSLSLPSDLQASATIIVALKYVCKKKKQTHCTNETNENNENAFRLGSNFKCLITLHIQPIVNCESQICYLLSIRNVGHFCFYSLLT